MIWLISAALFFSFGSLVLIQDVNKKVDRVLAIIRQSSNSKEKFMSEIKEIIMQESHIVMQEFDLDGIEFDPEDKSVN